MKQRETNEVRVCFLRTSPHRSLQIMAFKLHVILMTLKDAFESLDKQLAIVALGCPVEKSDTQILEAFIRFLLKAEVRLLHRMCVHTLCRRNTISPNKWNV
jgi:hypothetical protein